MATYVDALSSGAALRLIVNQTSQNIASNYSVVSWSLAIIEGSASSFSNTAIGYNVKINGVTTSGSYTFDFRPSGTQTKTIDSGSSRVYHDADGTKTITVSGYTASTGTTSGGPGTASGTLALTRIPRGPNIEVDGVWSRSLAYAEIDGVWTQCLVHAEIDGVWAMVGG